MESVQASGRSMPGPVGSRQENMQRFGGNPLTYMRQMADEYGDYVRIPLIMGQGVLLVDPDAIEEVLVRKKRHFVKGRATRALGALLGNGLLVSEGDFWRRQRRLAQPAFHKDRIARYGERMVAFGTRMVDRWHDGQEMDIHDEMVHVTLAIVADALFSADVSGVAEAVGESLATALWHFQWWSTNGFLVPVWLPLQPNRMFMAAKKRLDRIVNGIIAARQRSGERHNDLLDMLLAARDEDGSGMSPKQLRDEVMTLLLAGHETTANTLTWTFLLLGQHPEVEARLLAELREVLGGRPPSLADLPNLKYTEMVIKESMRVFPAVWMLGYQAIADTTIGSYLIRKGTTVFMSQWVNHHDGRWFPEPERFHPERWLDPALKSLPAYAYFPFGGGERMCIGKSFALMEAQLLLATIVQRYHLDVVPGQQILLNPSVTLRPGAGLRVTACDRKK
jgi:cytochrome P450